jgi:hypothetical protein
MKKQMVRELARRYLVVQAAIDTGIDTLPDVITKRTALRIKYAKQLIWDKGRDPNWMPPDNLVKQYFNEHIDDFTVKKPLTVQHIITEDSVFGEFIRDQAMAGVDFIELAKQYYPGEPSVRADLANLGDIGPEDVSPEFYQAALLTPVGEVSHPIKTKYGYHIIKVLRRADSVTVDQVRHKIVPILRERHAVELFNNFRDELYAEFNVRFHGKIYPVHLKPVELRAQKQ